MYFIKRILFWAKKLTYLVIEFAQNRQRIVLKKIPVANTIWGKVIIIPFSPGEGRSGSITAQGMGYSGILFYKTPSCVEITFLQTGISTQVLHIIFHG